MPCSNQTSRKLGTANRDAVPKPGLLGAPEPGRTPPLQGATRLLVQDLTTVSHGLRETRTSVHICFSLMPIDK
ncbi:hypothetical protein CLIM01_11135 [Colletotrichum limetticola]|uniref:Uncharacterized protein n=1 Tax=Colletotrichum limetticola TaxID=1209924 RepID=A0ABQ9PM01_9PEZI|nr:hypothetical protein CLIM01_11135 [Colletotrichum limetticola]